MDLLARRVTWTAAFVAGASLTGLLMPTGLFSSPGIIGIIWALSFWADVVFVAGCIGVLWLGTLVSRQAYGMHWPRGAAVTAAAVTAGLAMWAVYSVSFQLALPALDLDFGFDGSAGGSPDFFAMQFEPDVVDVWAGTFMWGWPGLLFTASVGGWSAFRGMVAQAPEIEQVVVRPLHQDQQ